MEIKHNYDPEELRKEVEGLYRDSQAFHEKKRQILLRRKNNIKGII